MYQKYYEDVNKIVPYKHAMKKNLKNRMPIYVYICTVCKVILVARSDLSIRMAILSNTRAHY